jgi:hypothetical protein
MCLLWDRDFDEITCVIDELYEPKNGEILIHGHSITTREKELTPKGYSPGKIWRIGDSINIDCGLAYKVSKLDSTAIKYGNLAAYCLDTGEVEYLWDIPDDYPVIGGEYLDEKLARWEAEKKAKEEADNKARERCQHLRDSFYSLVLKNKELPGCHRVSFNFWDDYFCGKISTEFYRLAEFDESKHLPMAFIRGYPETGCDTLFIFHSARKEWTALQMPLQSYKLTTIGKELFLFGMSDYGDINAEVSLDDANSGDAVLRYSFRPAFCLDCAKAMEGDSKIEEPSSYGCSRPNMSNGLATCDFFLNDDSLYTIKVVQSRSNLIHARIVDSQGNMVDEFRRSYYGSQNLG